MNPRTLYLIKRTEIEVSSQMSKALEQHSITPIQFTVLYFVDFDKLSDLKILPVWLDDLKQAIQTNIIDEVIFDPTAFNKQLGLNVGSSTVKHNMKNLLILDISSSMPKSVVITITQLAKLFICSRGTIYNIINGVGACYRKEAC